MFWSYDALGEFGSAIAEFGRARAAFRGSQVDLLFEGIEP